MYPIRLAFLVAAHHSFIRRALLTQVEEEIGIQLKLEEMVDLTSFLGQSTRFRVFSSPVVRSKFLFEAKFIQGH
ncbi:nudix hydrolase 14 [Cucumis melo var. makuwa]|uniref:Nudix hydrolase 14 n=1 Tax=Cucumis melo var. makuwa TaxID=1194695 RepID=A0A5D3BA38_CUCMM|nr:nudix hydrolase 14 [Cucumis melo var. makuwa]TYJ95804.1 nudix hydrolase 14 [Cucumis melo var. makuwa]